jgi:hypothetical protein
VFACTIRRLLAGFFAALIIVVAASAWGQPPAAKADPFVDGAKAGGIVWASGDDKEDARGIRGLAPIPDSDAPVVYSPDVNPFVAIGQEVYDLTQGKAVGKAPRDKSTHRGKAALSPNGKWFAHELQDPQSRIKSIVVLDTATGEKKHEIKFATTILGRVIHLSFTSAGHLACVTHEKSGSQIQIVSMDSGKPLKKFDTKDLLDDRKIAFNGSGQYLATVLTTRLVVFDVVKAKEVAEMETPAIDTGHPFIFVESLAFSADTSELAAMLSAGAAGKRLLIWSANGKIVEEYDLGLTVRAGYNLDNPLLWSPDGKALLINGDFLFERGLKSVAWLCQPHPSHHYPHRFLDAEHLLVTRGDFQNRYLATVRIPRKEIDAAAAALAAGGAAVLRPGDTVRLDLQVGQTQFTQAAQVTGALQKQVADRLAVGGLKISDQANLTLTVKYSESAGNQLNVVEGDRFGFGGKATGQKVLETVGVLEAALVAKDSGKTLWEKKIVKGNPHFIDGKVINDQAVREKMFSGVEFLIRTMPFPYFISADPAAPSLPIVVSLEK